MGLNCSEIITFLEEVAPPHLCEDWDNVGLILGSRNQDIKKILVCLDVTKNVADEAIKQKADLIISHHPFIFRGIKRINPEDTKGGIIYKLIKENICVYSAHTNLDFAEKGLNYCLAKSLNLKNIKNLKTHKSQKLFKIVVYVPVDYKDKVIDSMTRSGAGWIGNYKDCTFSSEGNGTFRPLEGSNPFIGKTGELENVKEFRIETIVKEEILNKVVDSMLEAHPYEEPAYDIYSLAQSGKEYGFGKTGELEAPLTLQEFVSEVKKSLKLENIRLIGNRNENIKKVAVFCGSFDESVISSLKKVDVLVTGDIKYHTALDIAEAGMCVIDAGHFGTERIIVNEVVDLIKGRFPSIEVIPSSVEKDPLKVT